LIGPTNTVRQIAFDPPNTEGVTGLPRSETTSVGGPAATPAPTATLSSLGALTAKYSGVGAPSFSRLMTLTSTGPAPAATQ
jgi:hypothetical protein